MWRFILKFITGTVYIAVVVLVASFVIFQWGVFEGVIIIEKGRSEHWVARPHENAGIFSLAYRGLPAGVVGFDNPDAVVRILDEEKAYDVEPLPFTLHLKEVEILKEPPRRSVLELISPQKHTTLDVQIGQTVEIPEGTLVVEAIEPWSGLVRNARGSPMASVAFQKNKQPWHTPVFPVAEHPLHPLPGVMVHLRCYPDEKTAREALPEKVNATHEYRWGIREEGRIHWFDSLNPGTKLSTVTGTTYTLIEAVLPPRSPKAHIRVKREIPSKTSTLMIQANTDSGHDEVLFEYYENEVVFMMHGWCDGKVWVASYLSGTKQQESLLREGDTLTVELPEQETLCFRLNQMMMHAVLIPEFEEGVKALVLDTPGGVLRLREGMSRQLETTRVAFRRLFQAPSVRYGLRAVYGSQEPPHPFTLNPQESHCIDNWRITHDVAHLEAASIAVLSVRSIPGIIGRYGVLLFLIVAPAVLLFMRFLLHRNPFKGSAIDIKAGPSEAEWRDDDGSRPIDLPSATASNSHNL